ncbi:MAG: TraR/DksA C4-type zinc finger protein, partial [Caldilineales bacterium]|nr:TraR/DksA C4-type zinc finger protein [Caldilineales bacterium]
MTTTDAFYHAIAQRLTERRRQLEAELEHFETWNMARLGYGHALVDDAGAAFDQATQLALRRHTERLLAQVDEALARLEAGTYGICEQCGQTIAVERLEAVIDARLCVRCQRQQDGAATDRPRPLPTFRRTG